MAGSRERKVLRTSTPPSPGRGIASSVNWKSLSVGRPSGRAASRTWRFVPVVPCVIVLFLSPARRAGTAYRGSRPRQGDKGPKGHQGHQGRANPGLGSLFHVLDVLGVLEVLAP